jgi:hypothetical protein
VVGERVPNVSLHVPGLVVAYRNHPVAANWFGLADPFSVAPVLDTEVAAAVTTVGAADVVNESTDPNLVPTEFEAMAQ